jgi:activating signal cointegrator 1
MKAITLHQPWAWLVAFGMKEVETRSWSTDYRGPLAIHAGKKHDVDGKILHLRMNSVRGCPAVCPVFEDLPFGCVVATCNLMAVVPTHAMEYLLRRILKGPYEPARGWDFERLFGNYAAGRFAWILRDVVPVDIPIPAHGWQKLWNWTPPASANLGLVP